MQELIAKQIRKYFQENGWEFDEEEDCFTTGYALDGTVEGAFLNIVVQEKSFVLLTAPDMEIPEKTFRKMEIYVNEVNNLLGIGCLYLDKEQKMLTFRTGLYCVDNTPTAAQIDDILGYSCTFVQIIAVVMLGLIAGKLTPEDAARQTVQPD